MKFYNSIQLENASFNVPAIHALIELQSSLLLINLQENETEYQVNFPNSRILRETEGLYKLLVSS